MVNNGFGSIIYYTDHQEQISINNLSFVKRLCIEFVFTYEGYIKAVKKNSKFKYKIPVYIDDSLLFIQTKRARNDDNIWFNYASVTNVSYLDQGVELEFMSGNKLFINISYEALKTQITYLKEIRKRKVNIFITNSIEKV
jgi:hypothetical protein